jgi:hypothetical protein
MTKPRPKPDNVIADTARRYGWYIDHAFDFRKRMIAKQVEHARKIVAEETRGDHPRDQAAYDSLESMADHLEWVQKEFDAAHAALKAAGIE